jgi:hypothetical protein
VIVIAGKKFTSDWCGATATNTSPTRTCWPKASGATEDVSTLEGAFQLLRRAINTLNERGMDIRSSTVKQMMLQLNPAFSERNFGCSQFKQFLDRATRATVVKAGRARHHSGEYAVLIDGRVRGPLRRSPGIQSGREETQGRSGAPRVANRARVTHPGRRGSSRGRGAASREQAADARPRDAAARRKRHLKQPQHPMS